MAKLIGLGSFFISAIMILALFSGFITARAEENKAVIIKDQLCGLLDGRGYPVMTNAMQAVKTFGGTTMLSCKANKVATSGKKTVFWNYENTGISCWTLYGATNKWQETVSASGEATLQCLYK